jgi:formamidopyrimidine-DNA glycosylase
LRKIFDFSQHKPFEKYNFIRNNLPLKLLDVKTKGKLLYMIFENNIYILSTLGLTGGWCYFSENKNKFIYSRNIDDYAMYLTKNKINSYLDKSLKHLNIKFVTDTGTLYYFDTLSFGTMKCINNEIDLIKKLNTIGPDIMDESTNFNLFLSRINKKNNLNKEIGLVLMNQKTISGIGNYLRSDILYISKINPFTKVKNLNETNLKIIFKNSKILTWGQYNIKKAIELNIIKKTIKLPSDYNRLFYIYNQETYIYNNKVIKKELYEGSQKRFIYYVPSIQILIIP